MCEEEPETSQSEGRVEYDSIARIYDLWASFDPASQLCWEFYQREVTRHGGVCLEVGVGTGAVMLGVGVGPDHYYGVDVSRAMLDELRRKLANQKSLSFSCTLIHGDILQTKLSGPAPTLVIIPFRAIGHFLTPHSKINLLRHLRNISATGALCLLDHFKFNAKWAHQHDRITRRMGKGNIYGQTLFLTDTYEYDFSRHEIHCVLGAEQITEEGMVIEKQYSNFRFSWMEDDEVSFYARETGWQVEQRWGGFDYSDFTEDAKDQIWLLRAT